jgi:cholesterol transport system auxiliary component
MQAFNRSEIKLALRTAAIAAALLVGACSGGAPLETYDLAAVNAPRTSGVVRGQVIVIEPVASTALETDRILVRPQPESLAYLTGAKWSARLPSLVQTRLIQSVENSRSLKAVGRPGDHLTADYDLTSEIRNFEIDVQSNEAVVQIAARLVSDTTGRVIAAEIFTARVPASANDSAAAANALDQALGQVMGEIVAWTARRG